MPEVILNHNGESIRYAMDKEILNIGRSKDNDIILENLSVSRNHARIRLENDQYILIDLNSANGTLVNGRKVNKIAVQNGDVITVGKHEFKFVDDEIAGDQSELLQTGLPDVVGPVREPSHTAVQPALIISKGRKKWNYELTKAETSIGKGKTNDIPLPDLFASKRHALIIHQEREFFIRDLGSWRGTILNDHPVKEEDGPQSLHEGDVIQIGACQLKFTYEDQSKTADTGNPAAGAQPTPFNPDKTPVMAFPRDTGARQEEDHSEDLVVFSDGDEFENEEQDSKSNVDVHEIFIQEFAGGAAKIHDETNPIAFPPEPPEEMAEATANSEAELIVEDHDRTDPMDSALYGEESAEDQLLLDDYEAHDAADSASAEPHIEELEELDFAGDTANTALRERDEPPSVESVMALYNDTAPAAEKKSVEKTDTFRIEPAKPAEPEPVETASRRDVREFIELNTAEQEESASERDIREYVAQAAAEPEKSIDDVRSADLSSAESSVQNIKLTDKQEREVKMWLKALQNNSTLIRAEAKRRLKELTGKNYD